DFRWWVGVRVPGVELALPAAGEDDQDRRRLTEPGSSGSGRGGASQPRGPQQRGQADAQPVATGRKPASGFEACQKAAHGWKRLSHKALSWASVLMLPPSPYNPRMLFEQIT